MDAKTLCLGSLMVGDATGYEIRKMFEDGAFSCFHQIGYGSIYPALSRLQADGLATVTEHDQDGRPGKKVYAITEAGRRAFAEALQGPPGADSFRSDTLFILAFGDLLPLERRSALLDAYSAIHATLLRELEEEPIDEEQCTPGHLFVRNYGLTIYKAIVKYIADNRHLLEQPSQATDDQASTPTPRTHAKGR